MRLVFLGSPAPVLAPLKTLLELGPARGHTVVGVVSQPARPVGRSGAPQDPPIAAFAKAAGLPVLQPEKAGDPAFLAALKELDADVMITAAFGQILPDAFLALPKRGTINIHPSLLPAYRGATPVPAALLDGETVTGVTVLFTVKALDAGNVIIQEKTPIGAHETTAQLTDRTFALSGRLVLDALDKLRDPAFQGTPQDQAKVTHCKKIQKQDGQIDWERSADEIYNRFRAYEPWPGTFTFQAGRRIALPELKPEPQGRTALGPGEAILDKKHHCLTVGTGDGAIRILKLKPAGGKEVHAEAFWNGLKDRSLVRFGGDPS